MDASGVYYLYEDVNYFYLETTGEGWNIGDFPEEFQGELAYLYPLNPIPICVLNWSASIVGEMLIVAVTVENVGTSEARGIKIFAGFKVGYSLLLNPGESDFFYLDVEGASSLEILLSVPDERNMCLVVRVLDPCGLVLDESSSNFINSLAGSAACASDYLLNYYSFNRSRTYLRSFARKRESWRIISVLCSRTSFKLLSKLLLSNNDFRLLF